MAQAVHGYSPCSFRRAREGWVETDDEFCEEEVWQRPDKISSMSHGWALEQPCVQGEERDQQAEPVGRASPGEGPHTHNTGSQPFSKKKIVGIFFIFIF